MTSKLNPYISFQGNAKEAMEFYKTVFGGNLSLTTFKEGGMTQNQANADQIMHGILEVENGMTIMSADTPDGMEYKPGTNISISLSGDDEAELTGYYNKLADGGKVAEPLAKAPWGDTFGMLTDKFGIFWMVNIAGEKS
ncbi:MAG TPA: VOC family protein [Candidatus Polarisedimenticolaceae bacterium]|nr:VOC family protein [Candidatus Polarisedimenticolaceae bacterium]